MEKKTYITELSLKFLELTFRSQVLLNNNHQKVKRIQVYYNYQNADINASH